GMGDYGDAAGVVDQLDSLLGARPAPRDERFRAGDEVLLEERAEVGAGAGGLGDVGAPDRIGGAGLGDGVLEGDIDAVLVELGDDLLGAVDALLLSAVAGRLDLGEVDPVAADVEVLGVPVDAGHLDGGDVLQTELGRGPVRLLHPGNAVVVGQRHHGYSRLGGGADDVGGRELAVGDGRMRLEIDHVCHSYPSRSTK